MVRVKIIQQVNEYEEGKEYDVPFLLAHTLYNTGCAIIIGEKLEEDKPKEKKEKKPEKKKKNFNFDDASDAFVRLNQANHFVKRQPLFYDKAKMWWMWDHEKYCYVQTDDVDILNGISTSLNLDTTNNKIKSEILNALKQVGRNEIPDEPGKSWVQFKDKIVDVQTGDIFDATPEYFITNPIPWKIGESEDTPTMDRLFKEWVYLKGHQDEKYIDQLYDHTAYATLQDQFMQRLMAYTGSGANGKGVYLRLLEKFLGEDNICTTELKLLVSNNFEASALYKKQAVFMTEVDSYDMKNTNLLKKITGEDPIRYEFKGKTPFQAKSNTTAFMATNSLPVTPDKSYGFYRRWDIIDFPHVFTVGRDIISEIPDVEFENLAKKCIRICKRLYDTRRFTIELTGEEKAQRYESRSNPLMDFITEEMVENPESYIIFNKFHGIFCEFLLKKRLRTMTKIITSRGLKNEGFQVKGRRAMAEDGSEIQTTCVFGLGLKVEEEQTIEINTTPEEVQ